MSNIENTEAQEAQEAETVELSPAGQLAQTFAAKKRLVIPSGADLTALQAFLGNFRSNLEEETEENAALEELQDWTDGVEYEAPTYLFVQSENGENRFIALPNKDVAMNDPIIRSKAYDWYIGKAAIAGKKDDSAATLFRTPAGFFLGFDKEAFAFQADEWLAFLAKKGAKLNSKRLRQVLSSAAHAQALYAKVPQDFWRKVLNGMIEKAEKTGHSAAILQHWLSTRDVTAAEMAEFNWNDAEVEAIAHQGIEPEKAPEAATA